MGVLDIIMKSMKNSNYYVHKHETSTRKNSIELERACEHFLNVNAGAILQHL